MWVLLFELLVTALLLCLALLGVCQRRALISLSLIAHQALWAGGCSASTGTAQALAVLGSLA